MAKIKSVGHLKIEITNLVPQIIREKGLRPAFVLEKAGRRGHRLIYTQKVLCEPKETTLIVLADVLGADPGELMEYRVENTETGDVYYIGGRRSHTRFTTAGVAHRRPAAPRKRRSEKGRTYEAIWIYTPKDGWLLNPLPDDYKPWDSLEISVASMPACRDEAMKRAREALLEIEDEVANVTYHAKKLPEKIELKKGSLALKRIGGRCGWRE